MSNDLELGPAGEGVRSNLKVSSYHSRRLVSTNQHMTLLLQNAQAGNSSSEADCGSATSVEGGGGGSGSGNDQDDEDDYGFSLSDGLYEKGVYVSAVRPTSPAAAAGGLQLFDRILQVRPTLIIRASVVPIFSGLAWHCLRP